MEHFGPHLLVDCFECDSQAVTNKALIEDFMVSTVTNANMRIINGPHVFYYSHEEIPKDSGVTGFLVLAESHLSIHTFLRHNFVTLDLYSCKEFPSGLIVQDIIKIFKPKSFKYSLIDRGVGFTRS